MNDDDATRPAQDRVSNNRHRHIIETGAGAIRATCRVRFVTTIKNLHPSLFGERGDQFCDGTHVPSWSTPMWRNWICRMMQGFEKRWSFGQLFRCPDHTELAPSDTVRTPWNTEPTLTEILSDPIVRALMDADGVEPHDIKAVLNRIGSSPSTRDRARQ